MVGFFLQIAWHEIPKALDNLFYALEPLVTGILLTNILQYVYVKMSRRKAGSHWKRWGPAYYVALATVFMMAQPIAVLFIYVGEVGYPEAKMWRNGSWFPNTPLGVTLYVLKWIGSICLAIGILQATQLVTKIRQKWCELRGLNTAKVGEDPAAECAD